MLGEWGRAEDRRGHVEVWDDPAVNRWLLVEHVPAFAVDPDTIAALTGDPLLTPFRARQHAAYRATGKVPFAFWIIQGDQGGHRLHYTPVEAELAQWYTGSREPPEPGSLPYADFDARVLRALEATEWLQTTYRGHYAESNNAEQALRKLRADIKAATEARMNDAIEAALPALMAADLPRTDNPIDFDSVNAEFIETGASNARAGSLSDGGSITVPFTP